MSCFSVFQRPCRLASLILLDNLKMGFIMSISKWGKILLIVMGFRNASVLRVIITLLYCAGVLKAVIGM